MDHVLDRAGILGAEDARVEPVEVPEWGGTVLVRALTAAERDHYEAGLLEERTEQRPRGPGGKRKGTRQTLGISLGRLENARAKLVVLCVVNQRGERLFGDDDVKALGAKSALALNRVYEMARDLAGLTDEDVAELAEGLDDGPIDGDSSSSPATSGAPSKSSSEDLEPAPSS